MPFCFVSSNFTPEASLNHYSSTEFQSLKHSEWHTLPCIDLAPKAGRCLGKEKGLLGSKSTYIRLPGMVWVLAPLTLLFPSKDQYPHGSGTTHIYSHTCLEVTHKALRPPPWEDIDLQPSLLGQLP